MKTIKENWKLVLIVAAGIVAVIFMCMLTARLSTETLIAIMA